MMTALIMNENGTVIESLIRVTAVEKLKGVGTADCIGLTTCSNRVTRLVDLDEGKTILLKSDKIK